MKIKILGKEITYSNETSVNTILAEIDTLLENSGYFFSHLNIDGIDVYEDIEGHIDLNRDNIKIIEVQVKTLREFSIEILWTLSDYIKGATSPLNNLISEFYSAPNSKAWQSLTLFTEALQWIYDAVQTIEHSSYRPVNWQQYKEIISNMNEQIAELGQGIQHKDTILIGDIIQYEIMPRFEELVKEVEITLKNEGIQP